MSLFTKSVLFALAGALAGLLTQNFPEMPAALRAVLSGAALGLLLGLVEALAADDYRQKGASLALGLICGAIGGAAGLLAGPLLLAWVSHSRAVHDLTETGRDSLRALAGASDAGALGLLVGLGLGAARRSAMLARQYALGGLLGGIIGGLTLMFTHVAFTHVAAAGALTGLGIGLLPLLRRPAWVRVKREGRSFGEEQILTRNITTFGAAETCDVTLRGDPAVAPVHAVVEAMAGQKRHKVRASGEGGFAPLTINDRPLVGEQWLADGDCFQIGAFRVSYHEWATRNALRLGPARPQVWTQATGVWQMTEMISARPASGVAAPPPPPGARATPPSVFVPPVFVPPATEPAEPETPLLGLSRDSAPLTAPEPHAPLPGAILRGESGPYVGRAFWLGAGAPVTIGRALERDISLTMDTSVSRLHARILFEGGHHVVSDAGSANGTYVNGERLFASHSLRRGDLISLGGTSLRYG